MPTTTLSLRPRSTHDFIEAYGEITHIGNTSRKMKFEARKVAVPRPDISDSAADFLAEPIVVAVAEGTCVTPRSASASLTKSFHTSKKQPCPPCGRGCFCGRGRTNSALSPPGPCAIIPLYFTA